MADYALTAGTVTSPFCPASWQAILEEFAQRLSVTIPSINGFIAQTSTPSASDQDKVWIKTSAAAPYVLGAYVYQGGAWRLVPAPVTATYFVDTGAANTWTITTGESIPDNAAYVTGRIWVVRVNNDVTGATTLQIDSFSAKSVKKQNDQALEAGDIESGQCALVIYDATSGNFELITTLGEQASPYKAAVIKKSGSTNSSPQSITLNTETAVEFGTEVDPSGFVTMSGTTIAQLGAGTYLFAITTPIRYTSGTAEGVLILKEGSSIVSTATWKIDTDTDDTTATIYHTVTPTAASTNYEVRFYSTQTCTLGVAANQGTYDETYQQWSILKLA